MWGTGQQSDRCVASYALCSSRRIDEVDHLTTLKCCGMLWYSWQGGWRENVPRTGAKICVAVERGWCQDCTCVQGNYEQVSVFRSIGVEVLIGSMKGSHDAAIKAIWAMMYRVQGD